jgi:anti-anti-sigma regulatory factor
MPTLQAMNLKPVDEQDSVLTGRGCAARLRERIQQAAGQGDDVVVDLEGVETISPSFADELFAKLDPELLESGRVRFENMPDGVEPLVRFVVGNRQRSLPA